MKETAARARPWLAILLLAALLAQGTALVLRTGVTYDEPLFIAAAHTYTHIGLGPSIRFHPPLSDHLTSLFISHLELHIPKAPGRRDQAVSEAEFGQHFLFRNRVPPEKLLRWARIPSLALTLLLGLVLWRWGADAAGAEAGLAVLFFFAFEPTLLGHGALVTKDIGVTAFMTAALAAWCRFLGRGGLGWSLAAGAAAGCALSCKLTALGLLPVMGLALAWPGRGGRPRDLKRDAQAFALTLAAAALVIVLVYSPSQVHLFFQSLTYRLGTQTEVIPSYFLGKTYPEGHLLYFPVSVLLKAPLPLLALAGWAILSPWIRRDHPEAVRLSSLMILVILAASLASRRQHGIRYVLPVFPMLCLLAGVAASKLWKSGGKRRLLAGAAGLWTLTSVLSGFPRHLSYFNEAAGGSARAYRVLGDSSLDWGQSLPDLKLFLEKNPGSVILSYFGQDCPPWRGIRAQEAFSTPGLCSGRSRPNALESEREWLVVSATKWQGFFERAEPMWSWLRDREPSAVLGDTLLVYDVTQDAQAHRQLAAMYDEAGLKSFSSRERLRAARIEEEGTGAGS